MFYRFQIMKGRGSVEQHGAIVHRAFVGYSQAGSKVTPIFLLLGPTHIYFWVLLLDL